ncbi:MAG TPA: hypothetical protein VFA38_10250 [Nitrospirales bacterium]|nr:hypothetical protein [Nitrospirales bacterium]
MAERPRNITADLKELDRTRASMAQKLDLLEERVQETIEHARASVADVVDRAQTAAEDVVDRVEDFVDRTKQSFDPRHQTQQHPWLMLGAAIAAGYAFGHLQSRHESPLGHAGRQSEWADEDRGSASTLRVTPNIWESVSYRLQDEVETLKGAALAAADSLVRDLFREFIPALLRPLERTVREPLKPRGSTSEGGGSSYGC